MTTTQAAPTVERWDGWNTRRFLLYGKARPDRGGTWVPLTTDDLDDEALARAGWNVLSSFWLADGLERDAQVELARIWGRLKERLSEVDALTERRLASQLVTAQPGGCFDLDFTDAAAALEAVERIDRMVPGLRWSFSSGPTKPKRHGEFLVDASSWSPHLARATLRWAQEQVAAAGFVPRQGVADRRARFWALPTDPTGELGCVDLSNLNRSPGRGALLRPLGGLTKDGQGRKVLCPGSPPARPRVVIPAAMLEGAAREESAGARRAERIDRAREREAKLEPLVGPVNDRAIRLLSGWLVQQRKPGDHHVVRMALCSLAMRKRLGNERLWVEALGRAWGDRPDAAGAWASTAARLRSRQPTKGLAYLWRTLGSAHMVQLAWTLTQALGVEYSVVLRRLAPPCGSRIVGLDSLTAAVGRVVDPLATITRKGNATKNRPPSVEPRAEAMVQRLRKVEGCKLYRLDHRCDLCGKYRCKRHMTCHAKELCGGCMLRYMSMRVEAIERYWKAPEYTAVTRAFDTKAEAEKAIKRLSSDLAVGEKPLGFLSPDPVSKKGGAIRWRVTLIAPEGIQTANQIRLLASDTTEQIRHNLTKRQAIQRVAYMLSLPWAAVHDLLERGRADDAAALLDQLYGKHVVRNAHTAALPWPTAQQAKELLQERLQAQERDPELCDMACPSDGVYDAVHVETETVLAYGLRYPPTLQDLIEAWSAGVDAGIYQQPEVERHEAVHLRL